jgi:phytol kinase
MVPVQPLTFSLPDSGDLMGALVLSTLFIAVFVAAEVAWRVFKVPTELTRKLVHAGGGTAVLLVPHLLSSLWVALGLAFAFAGILVVARRIEALPSVHAIERRSVGAFLFPISVCLCVLSSRGAFVHFEVPLLALAFGDAAAAIVGRSFGTIRYRVWGARRSVEGSLAFVLTTAVIAAGFFALAGMPIAVALTLALLVGLVLGVVEAVSVHGWDNLTIPAVGLVVTDLALRVAALPEPLRSQVLFLAVVVVVAVVAALAALVLAPATRRALR